MLCAAAHRHWRWKGCREVSLLQNFKSLGMQICSPTAEEASRHRRRKRSQKRVVLDLCRSVFPCSMNAADPIATGHCYRNFVHWGETEPSEKRKKDSDSYLWLQEVLKSQDRPQVLDAGSSLAGSHAETDDGPYSEVRWPFHLPCHLCLGCIGSCLRCS